MTIPDRWKVPKPKSVSDRADEAKRFVRGEGPPPENVAQGDNAGDVVVLPPPEPVPTTDAKEVTESELPLLPAQEESEPQAQAPPEPESEPSAVDWEHKYKSLKGKHDADMARLNRIIEEQAKQLENLHMMLADRAASASPPASEPPPAPLAVEEFSPEELEEFGPDLAKFVSKATRKELAGVLNDVLRRLDKVEREAAGAKAHSQRVLAESFYETMDRLVPEWRQLNTDRDFLAWLNGVDSFTGQTRISLLRQAEELKDAQRAAAFFKAWLEETGRSAGEQPAAPARAGRRDIRSLVVPGKAAPSTGTAPRRTIATVPPEKQPDIIRGADVQAFFARRRLMSPEEFEAGRRVIAQALREGRVVD